MINEKTSPLVGVLSKKKTTTHAQLQKPEAVMKRVEVTAPVVNVPPPTVIKNESVLPVGKQPIPR